jgi:hypothetical protein
MTWGHEPFGDGRIAPCGTKEHQLLVIGVA